MDEYTNWENKAKEAIKQYDYPHLTTQEALKAQQQGHQAIQKLREILEQPNGKMREMTNQERG